MAQIKPPRSRTDVDLATEALRMLNIIGVHEEAAGADGQDALNRWHEKWADLIDDGTVDFAYDEIPLAMFRACARLLADIIAPTYGRQPAADPDDAAGHPSYVRLYRYRAESGSGDQEEILMIEEF